ncbi:MAG: HAD-IA family hydrolase [Actinomycetota bacterium]
MTLLFIFDMDDVLYDYDYRVRMAGLTELTGIGFDELRERWWHDDGEWKAEAGGFDADGYLRAFNAALGVEVSERDWVRIRGRAMTPWPDSIAAVERAAELGQVTLLTNNGALSARNIATLAPELVPVFGDHLLTSSDYGARKPDTKLFQAVLERYGVPARDAFFADDLEKNVAGARAVGITAHRFTDAASLRAAIEEFAASRA